MTKYVLTVSTMLLLAACGNGNQTTSESTAQQYDKRNHEAHQQEMHGQTGEVTHAGEGVITMTADEYGFTPDRIRAHPGQQIQLEIDNNGNRLHAIEFHLGDDQELEQTIDPGASISMEFQAPSQPGSYEFYCPIGDHRDKGMTGILVVAPEEGSSPEQQDASDVTSR